mgnify:CR=1 FL=1
MSERINNYISDDEIGFLIEEFDMNYKEVAEYVKEEYDVEFSESTVGYHYRKYKEEYKEPEKPKLKIYNERGKGVFKEIKEFIKDLFSN